jgi:hypothetical protein
MRTASESTQKGRIKLLHLTLEDFCEALVRIASAKPMPMDAEVEASGCDDGGHFLHELRRVPAEREAWEARSNVDACLAVRWRSLHQPIWRALDHLLHYLVRAVEMSVSKSKDLTLSQAEVKKFKAGRGLSPPDAVGEGEAGLALQAIEVYRGEEVQGNRPATAQGSLRSGGGGTALFAGEDGQISVAVVVNDGRPATTTGRR